MSDLETRVRDALRADEIGWDDLRQPTLRVAPRSPRRWPTVLAVAAAVAVVATVAGLIAVNGNGNKNGSAGTPPAYAGYEWQMTALTDRRGPIANADSVPARIAFSDTAVIGTLVSTSIFGQYQVTPDGYDLTRLGVAGYEVTRFLGGGHLMRVGRAFASLFVRRTRQTVDLSNPAGVDARVSGDRLVLQANGVTMRLTRVGPSQISPIVDAVGYTWNVVTLTDKHGHLTIPGRLHARVSFSGYSYLLATDTVNSLEGVYVLRRYGFLIRGVRGSTAVGYAGQDPTVIRLIAAMDLLVQHRSAVTATITGDTLTLHRNDVTLTLHRGAAIPDSSVVGSATASAGPITAAPPVPPPSSASAVSGSAAARPGVASSLPYPPVRHGRGAPGSHH